MTEGKGRHREEGEREDMGWAGGRALERLGEGEKEGSSRVATSSCGSHSLSAPIPDRWRVGESWCQEAVTAGGQNWGEGALWPGFVWGGGSSWWSGCWVSLESAPREPWLGGDMDAVGQESGQGVSPPPAWDWLCPYIETTLPPPHPVASRALPPKTTPPLTGYQSRQGLWGLALICGQGGPVQGERGH